LDRHANRQIQAAQVANAVEPVGPKPATEWEARAGTKAGSKGWSAAATALEMADLMRALPGGAAA
jgi:6,7-dimethyl-8-ribityllumazine synthase